MYGTQTSAGIDGISIRFENDVKMYGTQTMDKYLPTLEEFENDVKMYGTQTSVQRVHYMFRLRMM